MRRAVLLAIVVLGLAAPSEHAVTYKTGAPIEMFGDPCGPQTGNVAYYSQQQDPTNNNAAIEPKVGQVFYVGITVQFQQYFSCAADFWAAVLTLPANVAPVVGQPDPNGGSNQLPVCIRRAFQGNQQFDDPRMTASCPTAISNGANGLTFNAGTHELRIGPKPTATTPDNSNYFFIGQRSPQENLLYTADTVMVPVKATAAVNAPMTALLCTVGTTCTSGSSVQMVVAATAPPSVNITLSDPITSAVGFDAPLAIRYAGMASVKIRHELADNSNPQSPFDVCGGFGYDNITIGGTFDFLVGNFDPAHTCYLTPDTAFLYEICHTQADGTTEIQCRRTGFRTAAVSSTFEPPEETATDRPDSTQAVLRSRSVLGPHPAGAVRLRSKLAGASDATYDFAGSQTAVGQSDADAPIADKQIGFAAPWSGYDVQSCFLTAKTMCGPPTRIVAGYMQATGDATGVTATTATASGLPSAPSQASSLSVRYGTTDPDINDPRTALDQSAAVSLPARADLAAGSATPITLTGLTPQKTYYWAACFDSPATTGIEDCGAVSSFTTTAAAVVTPTPTPTATATATASPTASPTPRDTTRPTGSIKLKGKVKRKKKITITVSAQDNVGVTSVSIKVPGKKAISGRKLKVKLPKKKGKFKITAVIKDAAGNSITLTRTVKVK